MKPPSGVITIRPVSIPSSASSRRRAATTWQIIRVSANASTGPVSTRTRNTQVTVYTETWRWYAISSLAAAAHSSPYSVIPATPTPIRLAGSAGLDGSSPRGGRPPVIQPSISGYAATTVKNSPGTITAGISTSSDSVCPPNESSQAGMSRSAPSRKPMYQSGTEPALMLPGSYGPNSHTGLICAAAPSATSTAPVNGSSGSTHRTRTARGGARRGGGGPPRPVVRPRTAARPTRPTPKGRPDPRGGVAGAGNRPPQLNRTGKHPSLQPYTPR